MRIAGSMSFDDMALAATGRIGMQYSHGIGSPDAVRHLSSVTPLRQARHSVDLIDEPPKE